MTAVETGPGPAAMGVMRPVEDEVRPAGDEALATVGTGDLAICCSGGGIRSAAFCLGALQSLDRSGLLEAAKWIIGVSGGSYIASSRALVANGLPSGTTPHAYAPATPEERNLRDNSRYIAPNAATVLVGALSLLLGTVVTFVLVTAPIFAVAHAWGWLLRARAVLTPTGSGTMTAASTATSWWLIPVIGAGITLALFMFWWLTLDNTDRSTSRATLVSWAALLTAGLALAMLAVPPLISWLTRTTGSLGAVTRALGFGVRPAWSLATVVGLIGAVATIAKFCQAGLAKWNALSGQKNQATGLVAKVAGFLRQKVLPWLASALVVLGGAVLTVLWISDGARSGYTPGQLLLVLAAVAVTVLGRAGVNVNRMSLHDVYRWRLANAFAVTRKAAQEHDPATQRRLFAKAAAVRLSELDGDARPELVICGTANINANREVPPGSGGFCVSFDPVNVTLRRETCADGEESVQARTADYEALVGLRRSTLFDISAISGAAVSPLMGSATRQAYRIALTAANIRLGVWLPHPEVVRAARQRITEQGAPRWKGSLWPVVLLAWYVLPHPHWHANEERNSSREALLWAHVLDLRWRGKRSGAIWYRLMQPTLGLLWSEAAGQLSYRGTWMYVTDGGHYDNLGLVEALHRGARHIVVLDASGDSVDTWSTLGGAISLARSDAGVSISLDPETMIAGGTNLKPGQVVQPWAHGTFTRPSGTSNATEAGDIWVCKLGWWAQAPWDIRAYAASHPTFPCDSTAVQMYDAAEFEAYHQLGAAAVESASGR